MSRPPGTNPVDSREERLEEVLAPPTVEEAEESLRYWRKRLARLPLHRRAERREAREMLSRWQQRLRDARRHEGNEHPLGSLLGPLADRLPSPRGLLALVTTLAIVLCVLLIVALVAVVVFWPDIQPVLDDLLRVTGNNGGD